MEAHHPHTQDTLTRDFKKIDAKFVDISIKLAVAEEQYKNVVDKLNGMETKINDLTKIMLKYFAYQKQPPQPVQQQGAQFQVQQPVQQPVQAPVQAPVQPVNNPFQFKTN